MRPCNPYACKILQHEEKFDVYVPVLFIAFLDNKTFSIGVDWLNCMNGIARTGALLAFGKSSL